MKFLARTIAAAVISVIVREALSRDSDTDSA